MPCCRSWHSCEATNQLENYVHPYKWIQMIISPLPTQKRDLKWRPQLLHVHFCQIPNLRKKTDLMTGSTLVGTLYIWHACASGSSKRWPKRDWSRDILPQFVGCHDLRNAKMVGKRAGFALFASSSAVRIILSHRSKCGTTSLMDFSPNGFEWMLVAKSTVVTWSEPIRRR